MTKVLGALVPWCLGVSFCEAALCVIPMVLNIPPAMASQIVIPVSLRRALSTVLIIRRTHTMFPKFQASRSFPGCLTSHSWLIDLHVEGELQRPVIPFE